MNVHSLSNLPGERMLPACTRRQLAGFSDCGSNESLRYLLLMSRRLNELRSDTLRNFSSDEHHLVGVSGGRDSVALLHWLVGHGYRKVIVCHLDHQLRGRSSKADARFVANLAAKYELDFEPESANVCALAAKKKLSLETSARTARYEFFARVARSHRCHTIFLAHHADDLVETFLINLFRGSGSSGLGAMREVSTRDIGGTNLKVVRPLLGTWRTQINDYIKVHRLKFREDASNRSLVPLRNRVRLRVIPFLEKELGRNIRVTIWRAAMIAAEERGWIENAVDEVGQGDLSVTKLRELPIALQRQSILKWLRAHDAAEVGFELIERVRSLFHPNAPAAKINLAQNRYVRRRAKKIFIE